MLAKRERGKIERRLVTSLTAACENNKSHIPGFEWVTHQVDYTRFPMSLMVIWVFDTDAHLSEALKSDVRQRLHDETAAALIEAGVMVNDVSAHIDFDSEQACRRQHGGDWQRRLTSVKAIH
ncbi:hypothetical protein B0H98_101904 [Vreelandella songnenensis]|uniref:Fis family transcriptional regulator n=1 Tax=Vreelandella songnenensis TaxID=1176243 RepID=A0A2T0V9P2_9GAMM|nr:hypothetical protein [Halomonas songnenensis]PRY66902.1 hypothetical protein B0H98_101904 [Halomonas songnenensis]